MHTMQLEDLLERLSLNQLKGCDIIKCVSKQEQIVIDVKSTAFLKKLSSTWADSSCILEEKVALGKCIADLVIRMNASVTMEFPRATFSSTMQPLSAHVDDRFLRSMDLTSTATYLKILVYVLANANRLCEPPLSALLLESSKHFTDVLRGLNGDAPVKCLLGSSKSTDRVGSHAFAGSDDCINKCCLHILQSSAQLLSDVKTRPPASLTMLCLRCVARVELRHAMVAATSDQWAKLSLYVFETVLTHLFKELTTDSTAIPDVSVWDEETLVPSTTKIRCLELCSRHIMLSLKANSEESVDFWLRFWSLFLSPAPCSSGSEGSEATRALSLSVLTRMVMCGCDVSIKIITSDSNRSQQHFDSIWTAIAKVIACSGAGAGTASTHFAGLSAIATLYSARGTGDLDLTSIWQQKLVTSGDEASRFDHMSRLVVGCIAWGSDVSCMMAGVKVLLENSKSDQQALKIYVRFLADILSVLQFRQRQEEVQIECLSLHETKNIASKAERQRWSVLDSIAIAQSCLCSSPCLASSNSYYISLLRFLYNTIRQAQGQLFTFDPCCQLYSFMANHSQEFVIEVEIMRLLVSLVTLTTTKCVSNGASSYVATSVSALLTILSSNPKCVIQPNTCVKIFQNQAVASLALLDKVVTKRDKSLFETSIRDGVIYSASKAASLLFEVLELRSSGRRDNICQLILGVVTLVEMPLLYYVYACVLWSQNHIELDSAVIAACLSRGDSATTAPTHATSTVEAFQFVRLLHVCEGCVNRLMAGSPSPFDHARVGALLAECVQSLELCLEGLLSEEELFMHALLTELVPVLLSMLRLYGCTSEQISILTKTLGFIDSFTDSRFVSELNGLLVDLRCAYQLQAIVHNNHESYGISIVFDHQSTDNGQDYKHVLDVVSLLTKIASSIDDPCGELLLERVDPLCKELVDNPKLSTPLRSAICVAWGVLLMCVYASHKRALVYAKLSLTMLDDSIPNACLRLDSILLIANIYDAVGFVDGCVSYLAEAISITKHSPCSTKDIVRLHSARLWHRLGSTARANQSLEDLRSSSIPLSPFSDHMHRMWDWHRNSNVFNTPLPHSLRRALSCSTIPACNTNHIKKTELSWKSIEQFHTIASSSSSLLVDEDGRCKSSPIIFSGFRNKDRASSSSSHCPAMELLNGLPTDFCTFDVMRALRRRAAIEVLCDSGDGLHAFVLAAASCGSSYEYLLQGNDGADGTESLRKACVGDSQALRDIAVQLNRVVTSASSTKDESRNKVPSSGSMISNGVILVIVADSADGTLFLGRYSVESSLVVLIPCGDAIADLLALWTDLMSRNKTQLKQSQTVKSWSNAEKKSWWGDRDEINVQFGVALHQMQSILGPWRCLLWSESNEEYSNRCEKTICALLAELMHDTLSTADFHSFKVWVMLLLSSTISSEDSIQTCTQRLTLIETESALVSLVEQGLRFSSLEAINVARKLIECYVLCCACPVAVVIVADTQSAREELTRSYSSKKVTELRSLLKEMGVSAVGKKEDLVNRLADAVMAETKENINPQHPCSDELASAANNSGFSVVILDESLQSLSIECMPCLLNCEVSRVPGLALLLSLLSSEQESHAKGSLSMEKSWYIVDPENNLPSTQSTLMSFLSPLILKYSWQGFLAAAPSILEFREMHESCDLFIYCGHGGGEAVCDTYRLRKYSACPAAFLWGCSSGQLIANGVHDPTGLSLVYLTRGAPCVIGNLWDVTDKDLDKLSVSCMEHLFIAKSEEESKPISACKALGRARRVVRMSHAVGSAPIVYGLPVVFSKM